MTCRCHGAIDNVRFNEGFVSLNIHDKCVGRQVGGCFRKTVRATLVIETRHDDFAPEFADGAGNALIIGRDEDAFDRFCALNSPVDVFYQRLTLNFNDGFPGETSGLESCRDDRYGAFEFHTVYVVEKIRCDYSTSLRTTGVRWLFDCL